ncbi:MAG: sulfite exporter TauE/SafE family protein [Oscillospiraceae bacterium]|jgi:sulfite exporter TauE/SafE/copper chaperone CopZ|nr:sulfite exporter TauE/SafE family protein [Oscillospiraceae bacterium]
MERKLETKTLRVGGMTCTACRGKIERKLRGTAGVAKADVSYAVGTAKVTYDPGVITPRGVAGVIELLGYSVINGKSGAGAGASPERRPGCKPALSIKTAAGALIAVFAVYTLLRYFGLTDIFRLFPTAEAGMSYGMLFVIGLLTSVHCAAMCGGINLSQSIQGSGKASLAPAALYNLGRVISYTVVGALVGALGSVVSFSGALRGVIQLIAGVFMIIMGINMFGVTFPGAAKLRAIAPRMPKIFTGFTDGKAGRAPLIVGLLNGLMPCGPLQAMQIYALSTGSPAAGALSMLLFSLGTVPLMFGLGAVSSRLSRRFAGRAVTVGAALVVVLGVSMLSQGWSLSGWSLGSVSGGTAGRRVGASAASSTATIEDGYQLVDSKLLPGRYPAITVQEGIPVKWTIDAPQGSINGCNNRMLIREYGVEHKFTVGENVIEFTPENTGKFSYSCWMGMIRGSITVTDGD